MNLLPHQLRPCLRRRVCLVGIGNPRLGDAAVGVRIAEALTPRPVAEADPSPVEAPRTADAPTQPDLRSTSVVLAPNDPLRCLPEIVQGAYDHVVFIDAVDFGGRPGAVTVLRSEEILRRCSLQQPDARSLGTLAEQIEANGHTKTWVLAVQPACLRPDRPLSQSVQGTARALVHLLSRETGLAPTLAAVPA